MGYDFRYMEDFTNKLTYHVFVMDRPERSLCNFEKLTTSQITRLLTEPPKLRPNMCPECSTVKEMLDIEEKA